MHNHKTNFKVFFSKKKKNEHKIHWIGYSVETDVSDNSDNFISRLFHTQFHALKFSLIHTWGYIIGNECATPFRNINAIEINSLTTTTLRRTAIQSDDDDVKNRFSKVFLC